MASQTALPGTMLKKELMKCFCVNYSSFLRDNLVNKPAYILLLNFSFLSIHTVNVCYVLSVHTVCFSGLLQNIWKKVWILLRVLTFNTIGELQWYISYQCISLF